MILYKVALGVGGTSPLAPGWGAGFWLAKIITATRVRGLSRFGYSERPEVARHWPLQSQLIGIA